MEGLEFSRYPFAGPQEVSSEHTLSTTLKTNLYLGAEGLGVALIQNGPYLQIVNIIDKGAAARNGRLKPGDILIKIGHANVLGCTLREVRHLLSNTPVGTGLQIMVYRDLVDIPKEWEDEVDLHPEPPLSCIKLENVSTSSEEEEGDNDFDFDTNFRCVMAAKSFWHDSCTELPPISKFWHSLKKNRKFLTVGLDIGCDVMVHRSFETGAPFTVQASRFSVGSQHDNSPHCRRLFPDISRNCSSQYCATVDDRLSSSSSPSSSSSLSGLDVFWLGDCAISLK